MPDTHCSKCCPVEPPKAETPVPWPVGALLALAIVGGAIAGLYALVMWAASSLF
ncbi:hypothetical protein [Streptomyces lydicus]|uniref:hypothetical protein n=1 Tax=Streptomyces lydicus TaxID=47763 RepID=UPI0037AA9883